MQILACCLHDTLVPSARASQSMISSRECQKRLLLAIQALVQQFRLLHDLLKGKLSETVLQQIPFRLFAARDLESLCELLCLGIETVRAFRWYSNLTEQPFCWCHLHGQLCSRKVNVCTSSSGHILAAPSLSTNSNAHAYLPASNSPAMPSSCCSCCRYSITCMQYQTEHALLHGMWTSSLH